MSIVVNEVRRGTYLDSVALMRVAQVLRGLDGVEDAGLMIGTPANVEVLAEAGVLDENGRSATAGDVVVAVRARSRAAADAALAAARVELDQRRGSGQSGGEATGWQPRTLATAVAASRSARLALISVPGAFAATEAQRALAADLDVMIFSDNVPLAEEVALKQEARRRGRLVMGPDCGTAIVGGLPLAFANVVPRGDIGIVGASGTGIQEVSCLVARAGAGISHAIGTGGRDLDAAVGAITTLAAIDLLDNDPATRHVVVISKPPAPAIAARVLERIGRSAKPFTVCFVGSATGQAAPANTRIVGTLAAAAEAAVASRRGAASSTDPVLPTVDPTKLPRPRGPRVVGLFAGGTLAAEAQVVLLGRGLSVASNAPIPGATTVAVTTSDPVGDAGHVLLDLGDDQFTRGRPHPMIEPSVRDHPLDAALADRRVGVVLLDVVLGLGSHADPAGHVARRIAGRGSAEGPIIVASVTGTEADPQGWSRQAAALASAGVIVMPSNAAAAELAADLATRAVGQA